MFDKNNLTRKCGNYSDVLPLKAARRDSINSEGRYNLRSGFEPFVDQSS